MPPVNIEQQVNPEDEQLQQELEQLNELIALRASEIEAEKARKEKLQVE